MFVRLYWILPLFSTLVWLTMLLTMIIYWTVGPPNERIYPSMEPGQRIAYISDVGAFRLDPLFIAMATVTVVCLDASMIAERWLRHNGRLAPNTSTFQKVLDIIAILAAIVGALGIILLSIFNTNDYPNLHDAFLGVFLAGYVVSAIFICWEYQRLGKKFRKHQILAVSFWLKLLFIVVEFSLAIAFGVLNYKSKWNAAAVLEWTLAFIFTFYVFTFFIDLLPAVRTKHHMSHPAVAEMGDYSGPNGYTNGYPQGQSTNGYGSHYHGQMEGGGRDAGYRGTNY